MATEFSPINKAFFKTEETKGIGTTQTSANHIANIAKHTYQQLEAKLSNIHLHTIKMQVIGSSIPHIIQSETEYIDFERIPGTLETIAMLKSFIAFLREAIKEKDALLKEVNSFTLEELGDIKRPIEPVKLTEMDIINSWDTGKRRKYLELDTFAAVFGKYIHPDGYFYNIRRKFFEQSPTIVDPNGSNTLIYNYTTSYDEEIIDKMYMSLQATHRKYEAELNGMKNDIKQAIDKDFAEKLNTYNIELEEYRIKVAELHKKQTEIREARLKEVSQLKILIPKAFEELYSSLKSN